ncbi:hypothetical protein LSTR_LSTR000668 [Laodelphax striatellus]|uniref:BAH domain-containing protein n=1 Tax=Laodelphax striatellus TaxID=195883 RepID=A0A482XFR8_LAOST|nr:hypothetical protein LSTR_LSTR000668 [Laodelphax striatellus]
MILDDDEQSIDLLDEINENYEEINFERDTFEENDFVLVKFMKKQGPPEYYVGKIISSDEHHFEYKVQFYKRIRSSCKFMKESDEIFDVVEEDIFMRLPMPKEVKGSARTSGQLYFEVDFSSLNVK